MQKGWCPVPIITEIVSIFGQGLWACLGLITNRIYEVILLFQINQTDEKFFYKTFNISFEIGALWDFSKLC